LKTYYFTDAAEADLAIIWDRIAKDSETTADRYLGAIRAECEALTKAPLAGAVRLDLTSKPLRFWLVGPHNNHFIVYDPSSDPIQIMRVMHGARNVQKLLRL
jgi:plasmid stabilization system protein ParE